MKKSLALLLLIPLFIYGQEPYTYNGELLTNSNQVLYSELTPEKFKPTDLSNCLLWFDCSDTTTITKDASNYVSAWVNKGIFSTTATQATGSKQPLFKKNQLNNKHSLYFDGGDVLCWTPRLELGGTSHSFFAVYRQTDTLSNTFYTLIAYKGTSGIFVGRINSSPFNNKSSIIRSDNPWPGAISSDLAYVGNPLNYAIISFTNENNVAPKTTYYKNNIIRTTIFYDYKNPIGNIFELIGARGGAANEKMLKGYIAEIILYNRELTHYEMLKVNTYLQRKYGL